MKRKKLKLRKIRFLILIIFGLLIRNNYQNINIPKLKETNSFNIEEKIANKPLENNSPNYFAFLEIPKINLKQELFPLNSLNNNVDKNLFIVNKSVFPKVNKSSNVIIAGHSGNSKISYFQNLFKLTVNDKIYFTYEGIKYAYQVKEIEYQDKTGTLFLKSDFKNMLTLITCTNNDNKTQTIYYAEQEKV